MNRLGTTEYTGKGKRLMAPVGLISANFGRKHAAANVAVVLSCLFLIGIVWAVTLERIRFERDATIANATKQNANLAIAFEEHTIRTLKGIDQAVLFVKNQYDEHGLKLNIGRMIENGMLDASLFNYIGITDERGNVVLGSHEFKPTNVADRESFEVHRQNNNNEMFIGKLHLGRITHEWAMPMSHRINKADNSFGGIVYAAVVPDYFTRFYQQTDLGEQGVVTLIGLDGIVRARRAGQKSSFGQDMHDSRLFVEQAKSRNGSFLDESKADGVAHFVSFRTLTQYPLIVMVGTSEAETLTSFRGRMRSYYIGAGFVSAMIVVFAALMMMAWSRRKRALDSLVESEARYRGLLETAPDAVVIVDGAGLIQEVNAETERLFGYRRDELLGKQVGLLVPERFRDCHPHHIDDYLKQPSTRPMGGGAELWGLRKDGSEFPTEISLSPLRAEQGLYITSVIRDISERKRVEHAALEQFKLAETFFNHSVSCIVVLDRNFNFLRVNKAYARASRREIGEFAGRNHFDMYPSDAKAIFEEVVRTKKPFATFEWAFEYPDQPERGVTYWEWTLVPILDGQGEVEYVVFSLNEVTERKRAQEVFEQSIKRVQALSERVMKIQQGERDRIARELHDELGQTLTALKVNLQMLEPYCTDGEAEAHLTEALMITGRSLDQVRGMLLDLRPLGLEDLGLAVVLESHLARQAQATGWESHFEATLPGRLRPELEMACFRVAQEALTNVMRHAHAKRVWVTLGLNAGEVQLSVRDDGIGFDVAVVSDASGTGGFGLTGMQERARQMGGRLTIDSAPGCGTQVRASFSCELARIREPQANGQTRV